VEFRAAKDAEYACAVMNQVRLFDKPLKVNLSSSQRQKQLDVGAEIFVGGLDPMVDEGTLVATFSSFGNLVGEPKVARDESGNSLGYGFVSFDNFDSSDRAIEAMNNQYLMNKAIHVAYAFKRDGKGGRHGDAAERLLAEEARKHNYQLPSYQAPRPEPRALPTGAMAGGPYDAHLGSAPPVTPVGAAPDAIYGGGQPGWYPPPMDAGYGPPYNNGAQTPQYMGRGGGRWHSNRGRYR
jgi:splicing factor 3B subunit 4